MIYFPTHRTPGKGALSFFEANRDVPFDVKRIYYIYDVPEGVERGGHAHKKLRQLLFCPYGCIEILLDDGVRKEVVVLDNPNCGLVIQTPVWRETTWLQAGSVLCVAASDYYNESDYIRDYQEFLDYIKGDQT